MLPREHGNEVLALLIPRPFPQTDGQLSGGEVEDGQVDAGLREVDGAEEAVPEQVYL